MSVRHIDFIKIKPFKCLVVEIRPVRCYIETSSGMTKTAKWMSYEHWKELRILLNDITTSYEESKMIGSTEEIKCNEHKMKDGQLIKIGYMFVSHNAYKCQFLMPREDATWTDDENDDEDEESQTLRDKGGRYRALIPCAERLVVSVRLQNQTSLLKTPADKDLFKALDSSFVVTNTISDYFPSSQKKCVDSEPSVLQSHDEQNELKTMSGNHKQRTKYRHSDSNHRKKRLQTKSIFDSSTDESTDHNEEPVLRQLSQVRPLCSGKSDLYPSFKGIDFGSTRCHGEPMGFTKEGIKSEQKSGTEALMSDTEINFFSSELQSICNDTQSQIDWEVCDVDVKAEGQCMDDITMDSVKREQNDILDRTSDTEFYPSQNFSDVLEAPLSYSPENEQLSYECDVGESGYDYAYDCQRNIDEIDVDHTSVLNNEEDDTKRHFLQSNMNEFLYDEYPKRKDLELSPEKGSEIKLNGSPIIGNRKSQLCEMVDSSLAQTTLSSHCLVSKRKKRGKLKLFELEKSEELLESKNQWESPQKIEGWCKKQPCSNSEILEDSSDNPGYSSKIEDKVFPRNASKDIEGKTSVKSKISMTNSKNKSKTSQCWISNDVMNDIDGKRISKGQNSKRGKLKKLEWENSEELLESKNQCESPQKIAGWCQNQPCSNSEILEGINDNLGYSSKVEDKVFARKASKDVEGKTAIKSKINMKNAKHKLETSLSLVSNKVMSDTDGKSVSKTQNSKRKKRDKLKNVEWEKREELLESKNQCESPQKIVGWCKKQPCSNSEILEGISDSPGYSSKAEDEVSPKKASKDIEGKTSIKSKNNMTNAEPKLETSHYMVSNEVRNYIDGKIVSKRQILKKAKRGKLKKVEWEEREELLESKNQCESPQKIIGLCQNQPCSNSEILEGISDSPGYSSKVEDKVSPNATKNIEGKTSVKSKNIMTNAKHKLKTSIDKKKGKRNGRIHESEKTREGKKILREVMNEIEEMRKRKREDSPLPLDIFRSQALNASSDFKMTPGIKKKRRKQAGCKKIERPSCQPLMKEYLSKKLSVVAMEKKPKKDSSMNSKQAEDFEPERKLKTSDFLRFFGRKTNREKGKTSGNHTKKKSSTDMFIDSSEPSDSSIAFCDENSEENQSKSVKPCDNTYFSEEDAEGVIKNKLLPSLSVDANSSLPDMSAKSVYIDPNKSLICVTDIKTPLTESFCADDGTAILMELNPRIEHLRECKSKLTGVTISELSERVEDAHEYLRGIINENIFSEKHQNFKKNCNECGSLLSIEVYAVFDEEQSEFVMDLMKKKYSDKLQSAIKDNNVRRQYIWKVLVPCFFIKLTMDILNMTSEKQAQNQLMEICMNFAD